LNRSIVQLKELMLIALINVG